MRNDQADALENMWWLPLSDKTDRFFADMQVWWDTNMNKSDREWQDLSYWEVANVAMMYLARVEEQKEAEMAEKDLYRYWAEER